MAKADGIKKFFFCLWDEEQKKSVADNILCLHGNSLKKNLVVDKKRAVKHLFSCNEQVMMELIKFFIIKEKEKCTES